VYVVCAHRCTPSLLHPPLQDGSTPLHAAAVVGRAECVAALLAAGADVARKTQARARACVPVRCAALRCALMPRHSPPAQRGKTALHFAAAFGKLECAEALLDGGAAAEAADEEGLTALHAASAGGFADVVEALLEHGADRAARDKVRVRVRACACVDGD
jgi:ankyrin repeat protein